LPSGIVPTPGAVTVQLLPPLRRTWGGAVSPCLTVEYVPLPWYASACDPGPILPAKVQVPPASLSGMTLNVPRPAIALASEARVKVNPVTQIVPVR
jgi:hypothetical protein